MGLLDVAPLDGVFAPQGVIATHILVDESTLGDDEALVQAAVDFVNHVLHNCAALVPGEYPAEANGSYFADYYLAQVNNGGHGQYAHNSRMAPATLRYCRDGLLAMGADAHLAIFDAFIAIMSEGGARAQSIVEGGGFGYTDPGIEELDNRFFALETMTALNAAWLRALPCLRALPRPEYEAAMDALAAANPMLQARKDKAAASRAKMEAEDPSYSAAHACCAQEGATFERFTAGNLIGPNGAVGIEWGALSSAGSRWLKVIYNSHAEWRDDKRGLKGYYFYETRSRYPAEVGDGARRTTIYARKPGRPASMQQIADFSLMPLANFSRLLGPDESKSYPLFLGAIQAKHMPWLPRSIWSGFGFSEPHAAFRLFVASMLWDRSMAELVRLHPNLIAGDYKVLTAMAATGALAAAAAAAVRLLRPDQIAALRAEAPDDYEREQQNVFSQLREVYDWWLASLWRLGYDMEKMTVRKCPFLRPSAFAAAKALVAGKGDGSAGANLAHRMAYFDSEYPPGVLPAPDPAVIVRDTLDALSSSSMDMSLAWAGRALAKPFTNAGAGSSCALGRLEEPSALGSSSRSALIAVLSMIDPEKVEVLASFGVDFDSRGRRRKIEK